MCLLNTCVHHWFKNHVGLVVGHLQLLVTYSGKLVKLTKRRDITKSIKGGIKPKHTNKKKPQKLYLRYKNLQPHCDLIIIRHWIYYYISYSSKFFYWDMNSVGVMLYNNNNTIFIYIALFSYHIYVQKCFTSWPIGTHAKTYVLTKKEKETFINFE